MKVNFNITFGLVTKIMIPIISGFIALESYIYFKGQADVKDKMHDTSNDSKINYLVTKMDTVLKHQITMKDDIHDLKLKTDSNRNETKCLMTVTKNNIIKESKNKEELLEGMKQIAPYWNYQAPDTAKVKKKLSRQYLTLR
jgi:hypothetical protein